MHQIGSFPQRTSTLIHQPTEINPHLWSPGDQRTTRLGVRDEDELLTLDLRHSVGRHAVITLAVTARRPHQQRGGHHVERRGNEGQVEGPAQRAVHLVGEHGHPVEEVHPRQVAAHSG